MIARQWEAEVAAADDELAQGGPRLREQTSPIGQIVGQNLLDEAVRALQEDLAMLQAQQERGLGSMNGVLEQIGQELSAVRTQLSALAEPILAVHNGRHPASPEAHPEHDRERAETEVRLERLEKQVGLLLRGMDSIDGLRYQSDVHTRALARLTDLLGEVVRPKSIEGLAVLEQTVAVLELSQRRSARLQTVGLALLGIGLTPGLGALAWLLLRGGGF